MKPVIIIGGGIAGISTATELAETGKEVILVEKLSYLGGRVAGMNQYFPKLCPPYCGLEINIKRIKSNPGIKVLLNAEVKTISGQNGDYTLSIFQHSLQVNANCTVCGECEKVCPVNTDNAFNYNLDTRKAIHLPHEMSYPWKYHIDTAACQGESCGKCVAVCKYNAIDLTNTEKTIEYKASTIVFATGWKPYNHKNIDNLKPDLDNVISNMEMERLGAPNGPTVGDIKRPSDQAIPSSIAFVQCAGSRDENHLPYCSGVCCSASLKQALYFVEKYPGSKATIFYIDLRVSGRNEDFLQKARNHPNIHFIKGKVGLIKESPDNSKLIVKAEDVIGGQRIKEAFDMVVLAVGIQTEKHDMLESVKDEFDFYANKGEFIVTGCARQPMDVSSTVKDATAAAMKALIRINE